MWSLLARWLRRYLGIPVADANRFAGGGNPERCTMFPAAASRN